MTWKVAWPAELVATPEAGVITDEPFSAVNATITPGTGFWLWSSSVTVIVDADGRPPPRWKGWPAPTTG